MDTDLLEQARCWIVGVLVENPAWGAGSRLDKPDSGRSPRSLSWVVEDGNKMVQVVIWEDGESEVDFGDSETGEVRTKRRHLSGSRDVDELLNAVRDWLRSA